MIGAHLGLRGRDTRLDHVVDVRLAGLIVRFESNSDTVASAVLARHERAILTNPNAPASCVIRVIVTDDMASPRGESEVIWQFPDADHVTVLGRGMYGSADLETGVAIVLVSHGFVRQQLEFQRCVVEGMALVLLNRRDRHPVHAAALRRNRASLLLHGPSGVGKSTLAYAASRAGIDVLADDASRVQLNPVLRIWGDAARPRIRLLENTRRHFPELDGQQPNWLAGDGVMKISVEPKPRVAEPFASRARVCLLRRDGGPVTRLPATAAEVRDALLNAPEAALDLSPAQRVRVVSALAAPGGWRLSLSSDPTEAIPHLERMLDEMDHERD